jgi:thiamine-monophosphate kinase
MNRSRPDTLAEVGERAWLKRVRRLMAEDGAELPLGIGDDAAILPSAPGPLVVSTDALVEGVHFRFDWTTPRDLGHKALAVNLSDLAAMGARPLAAFLALSVPPQVRLADLTAFFLGLRAEGRKWGCPLAGGDMTRGPQWTLTVTVLGRLGVAGRKGRPAGPLRRDGARPGDWVYVTGWPGRSGAGREALRRGLSAAALARAHRRPVPRLREGAWLAALGCVDAALDLSDGLWDDAGKLAEASSVRLDLWRDALPVDPAVNRLARKLRRDPLDWVLFGGEDYELLLATRRRLDLARDWPAVEDLAPLSLIGRVAAGRGVRLLDAAGRPLPVRDRTWKHF